jgi:hypothetical protein
VHKLVNPIIKNTTQRCDKYYVCCRAAVLEVVVRTKGNVKQKNQVEAPTAPQLMQERAKVSCDFHDGKSERDAEK